MRRETQKIFKKLRKELAMTLLVLDSLETYFVSKRRAGLDVYAS